jgi:outer membrane protein OmpA-like peptidoglycan-associated protein
MKKLFSLISVLLVLAMLGACAAAPEPAPEPPPPPPEPEAEPDTQGPKLSAVFSSELFSPDGDGEHDEMFITLSAEDESGIWSWMIEIFEPNSEEHLFARLSDSGDPPTDLVWDGRSNITGELVQSASDYDWRFTVTDNAGNVSVLEGVIQVDILVIREGDQLRVQVPSIVFGANSGGFDGLDPEVVETNDYILNRIAAVLNKFSAYKVTVEGHTNPIEQNEARKRAEQEADLKLSAQRAQTVVDYLVNLGVDRSRLTPIGVGGSRTVAPYAGPDGKPNRENWWKNRRVEFLLIK